MRKIVLATQNQGKIKEFERMFGICNSSYERMLKAQKRAKEMIVYGKLLKMQEIF